MVPLFNYPGNCDKHFRSIEHLFAAAAISILVVLASIRDLGNPFELFCDEAMIGIRAPRETTVGRDPGDVRKPNERIRVTGRRYRHLSEHFHRE
jgi:hypothetical protein